MTAAIKGLAGALAVLGAAVLLSGQDRTAAPEAGTAEPMTEARDSLLNPAAPDSLQVTPEERAQFTLAEGAFFGNIFAEPPVAYTCSGARVPDDAWKDRVCAAPSGVTGPGGQALTRCGFVHVGACPRTGSLTDGRETYRELIFVHLKPSGL